MIAVGSPVETRRGRRSPAGPQRCSWLTPGPHRSINIAGNGTPETSQNGWGLQGERLGMRNGRSACGRRAGESPCHPFPLPVGRRGTMADVAGGWARKTAGSGRVSGIMAHLSKSRRAARRGYAIADWLWDAQYGRPQAYCRAVASLDSRKSRNSLLGIKKKDRDLRLSSLVNIPSGYSV